MSGVKTQGFNLATYWYQLFFVAHCQTLPEFQKNWPCWQDASFGLRVQILKLIFRNPPACKEMHKFFILEVMNRVKVLKNLLQFFNTQHIGGFSSLWHLFIQADVKLIRITNEDCLTLSQQRSCQHAKQSNSFDNVKKVEFLWHLLSSLQILFVSVFPFQNARRLATLWALPTSEQINQVHRYKLA